jgi:hypothetical protein
MNRRWDGHGGLPGATGAVRTIARLRPAHRASAHRRANSPSCPATALSALARAG